VGWLRWSASVVVVCGLAATSCGGDASSDGLETDSSAPESSSTPGESGATGDPEPDGDAEGIVTIVHEPEVSEPVTVWDEFLAEMDADGNGTLSVEEMSAAVEKRAAERSAKMISRMIEWQDTDGDGMLSQAELGGKMGQKMFSHLDADDDDVISEEEYANAEKRKCRGGRGMSGKHGNFGGNGDHGRGHKGG